MTIHRMEKDDYGFPALYAVRATKPDGTEFYKASANRTQMQDLMNYILSHDWRDVRFLDLSTKPDRRRAIDRFLGETQ